MYHNTLKNKEKILSVAPMMDWTDRRCRFFHRQLTRQALLYTEMVTADAVVHGDRERLIGFDDAEHPVALQLGGSDPAKLAEAARIGEDFGYDEVNLNVGCPSDRVQSGTFGACLMKAPDLVAECMTAMKEAVSIPVTVKSRIGVDDQDPGPALDHLAERVFAAGADALWVHARKAWLQGLSPRENRDVPPLDYERVYRLKKKFQNKFIGINGGILTLDEAVAHLEHIDGAMMGRAAYHAPALLVAVDDRVYGEATEPVDFPALIAVMAAYAERYLAAGGRLSHITRHMVGLCHGFPGARRYRQILSTEATRLDAGPDVLLKAFAEVDLTVREKAA